MQRKCWWERLTWVLHRRGCHLNHAETLLNHKADEATAQTHRKACNSFFSQCYMPCFHYYFICKSHFQIFLNGFIWGRELECLSTDSLLPTPTANGTETGPRVKPRTRTQSRPPVWVAVPQPPEPSSSIMPFCRIRKLEARTRVRPESSYSEEGNEPLHRYTKHPTLCS